ncbi:lipid-A-disaccharide synthase [Prosthecochloris sp. GSB1]|uniref:lipid-A-disaccharide synthase n=1 Tax=Prosthecochloris sp. GSB1 TaxID=281093 RepID=UPI000B8C7D06|nr:lipid-A-disaccharide synthase [Prosthecochloris sp. GSB1]ASQ89904.1 lipid-A-disaccharide synthase [Prosthecochloris sp. GSB1]
MTDRKKLFVLAGEVSGDQHAAGVVRAFLDRRPDVEVFGAGGSKMKELGVELLYDVDDLSVMGFVEVLGRVVRFRRIIADLKSRILSERPDAALLVDYPGMNLLMAAFLHRLNIPVVYYIPPKVWAWKEGRIAKIRDYVDRLLVIFDFEVPFFERHGVEARFVGNPVAEQVGLAELPPFDDFAGRHGIARDRKIIGILPGSRRQEITSIYPEMLKASALLSERYDPVFLLGRSTQIDRRLFDGYAEDAGIPVIECSAYETMRYSDLAFVTSGTATLEALCFGLPMIVVYRTGILNFEIAKRVVRLKNVSLANLVARGLDADSRVVPELLQHDATAANMAEEARRLLDDPKAAAAMRNELLGAKARLAESSPSREVAAELCDYFGC